jgi:hypothetical protein
MEMHASERQGIEMHGRGPLAECREGYSFQSLAIRIREALTDSSGVKFGHELGKLSYGNPLRTFG